MKNLFKNSYINNIALFKTSLQIPSLYFCSNIYLSLILFIGAIGILSYNITFYYFNINLFQYIYIAYLIL
jgi:hypothetical protein